MLHALVGHSDAVVPSEAVAEAIAECRRQLEAIDAAPQAGIFFTSVMEHDHQALLTEILDAFSGIELIGCTSDGEVSSHNDFVLDSMCLLLFCSDTLRFATGVGRNVSANAHAAAKEAAEQARAKLGSDGALAIVLPDGLSTIASPLESALRDAFGQQFPIFGGTAGDHFILKQTWQFHGDQVLTDAMPVLLIGGDLLYSSAICSGWNPIGRKVRLTGSRENVVQSIDNRPALEFYSHYLGDNVKEYTQFPLALFDEDSSEFSLRDPLVFNEDGSIQFIGHFPQNATVQLAEAGREEILAATKKASTAALEDYPGQRPALALIFSCTSRRQILGSLTGKECATLKSLAPPDMQFFGFYTYGEIGPLKRGGPTVYHNDSYVVLVIGEE